MRAERLLSMKFLSFMLLLCVAITVEEGMHLKRSRPNANPLDRTTDYHPGCIPRNADGSLIQCDVSGYGSMVFLCSRKGCWTKEPSTGLVVTPVERKRFEIFF